MANQPFITQNVPSLGSSGSNKPSSDIDSFLNRELGISGGSSGGPSGSFITQNVPSIDGSPSGGNSDLDSFLGRELGLDLTPRKPSTVTMEHTSDSYNSLMTPIPEKVEIDKDRGWRRITMPDGSQWVQDVETGEPIKSERDVSQEVKEDIRGDFEETQEEVDHKVSLFLGGTNVRSNLQALSSKPSFLDDLMDRGGDEARQEGKYAVEKKAHELYEDGKITVHAARAAVKNWRDPDIVAGFLEGDTSYWTDDNRGIFDRVTDFAQGQVDKFVDRGNDAMDAITGAPSGLAEGAVDSVNFLFDVAEKFDPYGEGGPASMEASKDSDFIRGLRQSFGLPVYTSDDAFEIPEGEGLTGDAKLDAESILRRDLGPENIADAEFEPTGNFFSDIAQGFGGTAQRLQGFTSSAQQEGNAPALRKYGATAIKWGVFEPLQLFSEVGMETLDVEGDIELPTGSPEGIPQSELSQELFGEPTIQRFSESESDWGTMRSYAEEVLKNKGVSSGVAAGMATAGIGLLGLVAEGADFFTGGAGTGSMKAAREASERSLRHMASRKLGMSVEDIPENVERYVIESSEQMLASQNSVQRNFILKNFDEKLATELPSDADDFIKRGSEERVVDIQSINLREEPEGEIMPDSSLGKRDPVEVFETSNGQYQIIDGNKTVAALRNGGVEKVPVRVRRPAPVVQNSNIIHRNTGKTLRELGEDWMPRFKNDVIESSRKSGIRLEGSKKIGEMPDELVERSIKSDDAINRKIADKNGDASQVTDVLRTRYSLEDQSDFNNIDSVISSLEGRGYRLVEMESARSGGIVAKMTTPEIKNGQHLVTELQFSTPSVNRARTDDAFAKELGFEQSGEGYMNKWKGREVADDHAEFVRDTKEASRLYAKAQELDASEMGTTSEQLSDAFAGKVNDIRSRTSKGRLADSDADVDSIFYEVDELSDADSAAAASIREGKPTRSKTQKQADLITQEKAKARDVVDQEYRKGKFEYENEKVLQYLQRKFQDRYNRVEKIQDQIEASSGVKLKESVDARLAMELFVGRANTRLEKLHDEVIKPFLKRMTDQDITMNDMGLYLQADHAVERNTKIASRNPDMPDGGSGMTNAQARQIMLEFQNDGKLQKIKGFAEEFRLKIIDKRLDLLVDSGLITPDLAKRLDNAYDKYVVLKRVTDEEEDVFKTGFSVIGEDIKRAEGGTSEVVNPFVQSIIDYEHAIVRAEKNRVGRTFLDLVRERPNPDLWEIRKTQSQAGIDKDGNIRMNDPDLEVGDNDIVVKEDGQTRIIRVHDDELAGAMKNIGTQRSFKALNKFNDYMRSVIITLNPGFLVSNFQRDLWNAVYNISGEGLDISRRKLVADTFRSIPDIYRVERGKEFGDFGKWYKELKEQGGAVGWINHQDVEQKFNGFMDEIIKYKKKGAKGKLKSVASSAYRFMEDANTSVEMAVRVSTYKNAVESGLSKKKAAKLAKNITVNFNKKGELGAMMDSFYLFANAGIQGAAVMMASMNPKKGQGGGSYGTAILAGGTIAGSFALSAYNYGINREGYEKIEDSQKRMNMIFMLPQPLADFAGTDNYVNLSLPYGYNIFKVMGDEAFEQAVNDKSFGKSARQLMLAMDDGFNPAASGSIAQMVSPTITDFPVRVLENKSWAGDPYMPPEEEVGSKKPDSQRYFSSVREPSKKTAQYINKLTGGNMKESGYVDVSPETLDMFIDYMGGGLGKFVGNSINSTMSVAGGEVPHKRNVPIFRKFIKEPIDIHEFEDNTPSAYDKLDRYLNATPEENVVYDIVDRSSTQKISKQDDARFQEALKKARANGTFTEEELNWAKQTYYNNQLDIYSARVIEMLEEIESREEFEEYFNEQPKAVRKRVNELTKEMTE